jgi:rubrerythrin
MSLTLEEALLTAIAAEEEASQFYRRLGSNTTETRAKALLDAMASDEESHAQHLRAMADRIVEGTLADIVVTTPTSLESRPDWEDVEDITYEQVLELGLEGERNAALFYSALADQTTGELQELLELLTAKELEHARNIKAISRK